MPGIPAKSELPAITRPEYPRAAAYPAEQMLAAHMGPNVLWLTEALSQVMDLRPGQRVLDLGCGKALSSIFLAKEFNVEVWAADLWIAPEENARRVRAAGLEARVFPLRVEAHSLPFAPEFFDTVVSVDAYHYFGTDEMYLGWHLLKHVRPGGQIGIVAPGLRADFITVPDHLQPYWDWQFWTFHSPAWWQRHWAKTGLVNVEHADWVPQGWEAWLQWSDYTNQTRAEPDTTEANMLRADGGRWLGLTRMVGRKAVGRKQSAVGGRQ